MNGLTIYENFISVEREQKLLQEIDGSPWDSTLSRRVQQYGYLYNYKHGKQDLTKIGELPRWAEKLNKRLCKRLCTRSNKLVCKHFQQVIVNEYEPGQGISAHTDHKTAFGPVIVSISLADDVIMVFQRDDEKVEINLPRRSALVLSKQARYEWTHCIPARKKDGTRHRSRRVSITFRTVE